MLSFLNSDAPVKNQCEQLSALSQLECTASLSINGIDILLSGNLGSFDALVGENAYQIRTAQLCDLALRVSQDEAFKQSLVNEKHRIQQILAKIKQLQKAV